MGVLNNVFRRGDVFYFRARVPIGLRGKVRRSELWRSLRTGYPGEARQRGGILLCLTERLWRDLQRAMSPSEVQLFIDGWLKAKLDEDLEVRRLGDPEAVERHYAEQHEEFSGALWYKVKNDPTVAARHVDELLKALNIELDERDRDMANRFMIRAHLDLFKALVGRHDVRWRPWLDRDPAQALVDRLDRAPAPSPSPKHEPPAATFGKLSEVARQAIVDIGRLEDWRPKRRADYETAVETFIAAMARDPDMGEVSTEDAAGYMRDLTRYPSNATKRLPYRDLATFRERVDASIAADDGQVLDPVTINGKYLTPLRRIYEWRRVGSPGLINPFMGLRAERPRRPDPHKQRRDFSGSEVERLFGLPLFAGARGIEGKALYQPGPVRIDDWRVWVPLICFFSGMRVNEACGLALRDIRQEGGIDYFHVRDEVEGQSLKSVAARRKVPIHDELLSAGLLRFVARQERAGRTRLFEELEEDANGSAAQVRRIVARSTSRAAD